MKDLLKCSLDELLTEKQQAIENGNVARYRECNELISTMCANIDKLVTSKRIGNIEANFMEDYINDLYEQQDDSLF
jgi:hypothetical protein